jgi:hypothetical protein
MYPNYQIDPATGGLVNFYNGEPLDRNASSNDEADRIINMHRKLKAAGIEDPSKYINKSTIDANPYDDRDPNRSYKGRGTT